jgi:hypothetical protein
MRIAKMTFRQGAMALVLAGLLSGCVAVEVRRPRAEARRLPGG